MKTVVLIAKRGLLRWLEPVRLFWYAAERDGQIEIVDAEGLEGVELRARLQTVLAAHPNVAWRVVLVVDEQDARLPEPRLEVAVELGANREACQLLVFERSVASQVFLESPGAGMAPVIRARYARSPDRKAPTVVRAMDFTMEGRLEARLDAAYTVLALATLDATDDGWRALETFRGEFHLNNGGPRLGPQPGNVLPGGLYYTASQARLAATLEAYVGRLEGAKRALKAPTVDVALFGDEARKRVGEIVAERIGAIPVDEKDCWPAFGEDSDGHVRGADGSEARVHPSLPGGFWRRDDWGLWLGWRDRFDRGIAGLWDRMHRQARDAHEAGLASLRAVAPNERAVDVGSRSPAVERHPPERHTLDLKQVRSELARLERALNERPTTPAAGGAGLPDADWRSVETDLAVALTYRPTPRQVIVAAVVGVLGLLPAALLQVNVLSRVASFAAIVGLVVGVIFWVRGTPRCWPHRSSVLCRIARAIKGIRATASGRLQPLRDRRNRLIAVLVAQLGAWIDEQDVHSLRDAVVRLELDHARYLYHQRMLDLHADRATRLLEAIGGVAMPEVDRAPAGVEHVAPPDLRMPEHLEPTYALDADAWGAPEAAPQFVARGGAYDLEARYFPGLERIVFSRCGTDPSPAETEREGTR